MTRPSALAALVLFLVAAASAEGSRSVDLTSLDCYVRQGFSLAWSVSGPDLTDRNWMVVPARQGNRPVVVQSLPIPGKPAPKPFMVRPEKAQTYTLVFAFEAAPELLSSSTGVGLYLAAIGKNWEIYLNGHRIYSEVYRSRSGWFDRERCVRGALVDLDMRALKPGRNYLAIEVIGDTSDDRTGLFAGGPYLIGDYQELLRLKSEYVDLMLMEDSRRECTIVEAESTGTRKLPPWIICVAAHQTKRQDTAELVGAVYDRSPC